MSENLFSNEQRLNWFRALIPTPYFGEAIDVANGVLYLASDESRFVNGAELAIDGGVVAK